MKYILAFLLMLSMPCWAQVPMTGAGKSAGGPSYTGPGDVVASASGFWSCSRAYSAAYAAAAGNACDIVDVGTGVTSCTMKFATNGFPDLTSSLCTGGTLTVPAFCTAHTSCLVSKAYDQVGTSNCTGPCDAVQATNSARPALIFNCIGTIPCTTHDASVPQLLQTPTFTSPSPVSQPCSMIAVTQRSSGTAQNSIVVGSSSTTGIYFSGTAAQAFLYAGGTTTGIAAATGSPHAIQGAFNDAGSASLINIDTSGATSITPGTTGCITIGGITYGTNAGVAGEVVVMWEAGLYPVALNSTQIGQMNTNQHTTYGF